MASALSFLLEPTWSSFYVLRCTRPSLVFFAQVTYSLPKRNAVAGSENCYVLWEQGNKKKVRAAAELSGMESNHGLRRDRPEALPV